MLTVHLGSPKTLLAVWLDWAQPKSGDSVAPVLTLVGSRMVAQHLRQALTAQAHVVVHHRFRLLWDVVQSLAPPHAPLLTPDMAPIVLAPAVHEALGEQWADLPGTAEAFIDLALTLRLHGISSNRLAALPVTLRKPLAVAMAVLDRVAQRGYDEVRLYRYAANHLPVSFRSIRCAVYGLWDAHQGQWALLRSFAQTGSLDVFTPYLGLPEDTSISPWIDEWERLGARIIRYPGEPDPPLIGWEVLRPEAYPWAIRKIIVDEQAVVPKSQDWAIGSKTTEMASWLMPGLMASGVPARLAAETPVADESWRAAWAAADTEARPSDVLVWIGAGLRDITPAERRTLAHAGRYLDRWPSSVRERWAALREARQALMQVDRWTDAGTAVEHFAHVAGISSPQGPEHAQALSSWDQLGLRPTPAALQAWVGQLACKKREPVQAGVIVSDVLRLRGRFQSRLILTDVAEGIFPGIPVSNGLLTGDLCQSLGLPTVQDRLGEERHLLQWLLRSADCVHIVRTAHQQWPRGVQPKRVTSVVESLRDGGGLRCMNRGDEKRFGPYDGQFDAHALPVPTSTSGFETYGRCPLQYAFSYALGFRPWIEERPDPEPIQIGNWAHAVLQSLGGQPFSPEQAGTLVEHVLDRVMASDPPPPGLLPESLEALRSSLVADLTWTLMTHPQEGPVQTEQAFRMAWMAGHDIAGRIDRLEDRGQRMLVVDYKSGTLPPAGPHPTSLQLTVYAWATSRLTGRSLETIDAQFWGIRRGSHFGIRALMPPLEKRWAEAQTIMAGMVDRIERGELYAFPQGGACRTCAFRPACPSQVATLARQKAAAAPDFRLLWVRVESDLHEGEVRE